METEAALRLSCGRVQLVHYRLTEPMNERVQAHDHFRLELCLSSRDRSVRGRFCQHWASHRYEPMGTMFIVPPQMELHIRHREDFPSTAVVFELKPEAILAHFDSLPEATDRLLCASLDIRHVGIKGLLLQLVGELRNPGFASQALADAIGTQIIIELYRYGLTVSDSRAQGGLAPWQLRIIDERLQEVRDTPTLEALAKLCRISPRHLTRGFRKSRGYPLGAHVAARQLEHAKQLLATSATVTSIASHLGFSSASNFCFAFRRMAGISPGEFRRNVSSWRAEQVDSQIARINPHRTSNRRAALRP